MAAKAVVVFNNGQPLSNVECTFCLVSGTERKWPLTNSDGYTLLNDFPAASGYLKIVANNFKSYLQVVSLDNQNQTIRIANGPDAPNDIVLPALSFNKPSRDSIISMKGNFCNLYDASSLPIDESFIDHLIVYDEARALEWVNILKAAGSTHLSITLSGDYPENLGWIDRYPIPGHDWTNDLLGFSQILDWVENQGMIPLVKLAMDGFEFDPNGLTYGWKWGMDNLPRILQSLERHWDMCLWSTGYDGCFPTWSAQQVLAAIKMLKDVMGDRGNVDTEFAGPGSIGYCHLGNGEADWTDDKLGMLDSFSTELETNPAQADGIAQTATRLLGPKATNCPTAPYYLANTSKTIGINFFETVAYWFIHKQTNDYKNAAQLGAYYGFTNFGNGLP